MIPGVAASETGGAQTGARGAPGYGPAKSAWCGERNGAGKAGRRG